MQCWVYSLMISCRLLPSFTCVIHIYPLPTYSKRSKDIRLEVQMMRLSSHPNILQCYTSFIQDTNLWLVMQLMNKGSSLNCIQTVRKRCQIPLEQHITFILHQTILGLKYFHDNKNIHRDIKAGNILLDSEGNVRIADFGVSGWLVHGGKERENTRTFVGTPCWMAPEVMEQIHGYDYKADIWSLGITALELLKGHAPYAMYPPMKVLLLTIQEEPPSLETYTEEEPQEVECSESLRSMIDMCLQKDPSRRPSCDDLLQHIHFLPLADIDETKKYKERIKAEICDQIEDVGANGTDNERSQSQLKQPGHIPIFAVQSTEHSPHTSWVFSDGSEVLNSRSLEGSSQNDNEDFFNEFEQSTQGENFVHPSITEIKDESSTIIQSKETNGSNNDINDFMDQFEKETQGEDFLRER